MRKDQRHVVHAAAILGHVADLGELMEDAQRPALARARPAGMDAPRVIVGKGLLVVVAEEPEVVERAVQQPPAADDADLPGVRPPDGAAAVDRLEDEEAQVQPHELVRGQVPQVERNGLDAECAQEGPVAGGRPLGPLGPPLLAHLCPEVALVDGLTVRDIVGGRGRRRRLQRLAGLGGDRCGGKQSHNQDRRENRQAGLQRSGNHGNVPLLVESSSGSIAGLGRVNNPCLGSMQMPCQLPHFSCRIPWYNPAAVSRAAAQGRSRGAQPSAYGGRVPEESCERLLNPGGSRRRARASRGGERGRTASGWSSWRRRSSPSAPPPPPARTPTPSLTRSIRSLTRPAAETGCSPAATCGAWTANLRCTSGWTPRWSGSPACMTILSGACPP